MGTSGQMFPEYLLWAWCCSVHFANINSYTFSYKVGITIVPSGKQRLRVGNLP